MGALVVSVLSYPLVWAAACLPAEKIVSQYIGKQVDEGIRVFNTLALVYMVLLKSAL